MSLHVLLGDMPPARFVAEYFHRLPFCLARTALPLCQLGSWEILGQVLESPAADALVARDGERYSGAMPRSEAAARHLSTEGYTVLVRHAERSHAGIAELARAFEQDFLAPVDIHIYATPPGRFGFGWHYDAEDVFIVQTSGVKEYSLRKNTVNPWPLVEMMPADLGYQREIMPLQRVTLAAGDWLYIPCGYWHKASVATGSETAISLSIGLMSPAATSVLEFARGYLARSLLWRQRLPVAGSAADKTDVELEAALAETFAQLAADLHRSLQDEAFVREFVQHLRRSAPT